MTGEESGLHFQITCRQHPAAAVLAHATAFDCIGSRAFLSRVKRSGVWGSFGSDSQANPGPR